MSGSSSDSGEPVAWREQIRALEEEARAAFLSADLSTLDRLWADDYIVNSPLQRVLDKRGVLAALESGRIRHTVFEIEIEHLSRHGDIVIVMGRDRVVDPPDDAVSTRRYTNVWQLSEGVWRSIARHANVVVREPADGRSFPRPPEGLPTRHAGGTGATG